MTQEKSNSHPLHMWKYLADKHGLAALPEFYPQSFREDPILAGAFAQLQVAEAALRGRMEQLEEEDPNAPWK